MIGGSLTVSGVALILSKGDVGVIHAMVVGCGGLGLVIGSIVKLWEFSRHHEHR